MTFNEKLINIQKRFELKDIHMMDILKTTQEKLEKLKNGTIEPSKDEIAALEKSFCTKEKMLTNDNIDLPKYMSMKKEIDISKYKNPLKAYGEIIKEYYPTSWEIYVLTRIKNKNFLEEIWYSIFNTMEKEINKEMSFFAPNYLAKKDNKRLIIRITKSILEVEEIPLEITKEKKFTYKKYRYRVANKL